MKKVPRFSRTVNYINSRFGMTRIFLLCMSVLIFTYAMHAIIRINAGYHHASKTYEGIRREYQDQLNSPAPSNVQNTEGGSGLNPLQHSLPGTDVSSGVPGKFSDILQKNDQIVGWIKVPGTVIDYPVVQAEDNSFYLNHDALKAESKAGAIFMDFRNDIYQINSNMILYGHNMKDGSMFHPLTFYQQDDFFDEHGIINFDTLQEELSWEVFSVYVAAAEDNYLSTDFENEEEFLTYLNRAKEKSLIKKEIPLGAGDKILTLSTCSYHFKDARMVVHARLIQQKEG